MLESLEVGKSESALGPGTVTSIFQGWSGTGNRNHQKDEAEAQAPRVRGREWQGAELGG